MNNSPNICRKCKNFERYYTKGAKQFDKSPIGWCYCNRGVVSIDDCCDRFTVKAKVKMSKYTLRNCLSDLLTELSSLRHVIEADDE